MENLQITMKSFRINCGPKLVIARTLRITCGNEQNLLMVKSENSYKLLALAETCLDLSGVSAYYLYCGKLFGLVSYKRYFKDIMIKDITINNNTKLFCVAPGLLLVEMYM